ncbi:MAG: helix-turn-helix domain-containing protein [Planctomycetia bacterium]
MTPAPALLAPLPFGHASARAFDDVASCTGFLASLPGAPSRFDAIGSEKRFRIRFRPIALQGLSLFAGTSSAKATDHESRRLALVIPFGACASVVRGGGQEYRWASPHHAFFIPAGLRIDAESTAGSFLRIDIEEPALKRVAAGMAGAGRSRHGPLDLAAPRIVAMKTRGSRWLPAIRSICGLIDALDCDPSRLVMAGVDDAVLRLVAMMLAPEPLLGPRLETAAGRGVDLDALVERIMANPAGRITLTEMEAWSDRTGRAIQLAFQRRFGVSPMQWVLERRLECVHDRLTAAPEGATVREIAAACGIPRMATLIPEYTRRFGERPSDTLRRRDRHPPQAGPASAGRPRVAGERLSTTQPRVSDG